MIYQKPSHPQLWPLIALVAVACSAAPPGVGEVRSAAFSNGGFEAGSAGVVPPAPWALADFLNPNPNGVTLQNPQTYAGLNLVPQGMACATSADCFAGNFGTCQGGFCKPSARTITLNGANQPDPTLGAAASLRWPRYGSQCALINQLGNLSNVNDLTQIMTVGAADVDAADGKIHVRMVVAPVLEDPGHLSNQQPYFFVQLSNLTQSTVLYTNYNFSNQPGVPWQTITTGAGANARTYRYTDWQLVDIAPGSPALNMGDSVELQLIAAGCSIGGHMGELYVDGVGTTIPGLIVSGAGPAQANAGSNIAYTVSYRNGAASAATGAVIDFTTPPGTTFQSLVPPAGATCTAVAAGMPGTIVCTFTGPVPAGAAGQFNITVGINAAATGQVVAGTYDIHSDQETALLGNKVVTQLGCVRDSDCPAGDWCNEGQQACTPRVTNGTALPGDPLHMNPVLNGACSTAAAALVCVSGVCDTADQLCGYATGDGPCSAGSGAVVCRSGACGANGVCEPAGGCNVDGDCTGGRWCNESKHACTPQLANGVALPSDAPHMNPALNGACSAVAGALVCTSGVCDTTDQLCGYANGDGPCSTSTGATVCRSGVCDPDLKCGLADGDGPCQSNAQCRNNSCDPASKTCLVAKLPTGAACQSDGQCQSNACAQGVCSSTSFAGNGLSCAVHPGAAGGQTPLALFALWLVAAGLARRRRTAHRGA